MQQHVRAGIVAVMCALAVGHLQGGAQRGANGAGRGAGGDAPARGAGGNLVPSPAQFASAAAQEHVAAAMKIAGTDLLDDAKVFCTPTGPVRTNVARQAAGLPPLPNTPVEPLKIFENLYYIGLADVGTWVLSTSSGLIVFDALNNEQEARDVLVAGIQKMGLDPAQIKYLIVGHEHQDHTGGAKYIQDTYHPRVLMSATDWATVVARATPQKPEMRRDLDATDGQQLTLGDTTITFMDTPGHTPGTIAAIVPAKHQGRMHNVLLLSGMQITSAQSLRSWEHAYNDLAKAQRAEGAVSDHPNMAMNTMAIMESVSRQYPAGPHPLLYGPEKFSRYMDIMLECGRARQAALGMPPT